MNRFNIPDNYTIKKWLDSNGNDKVSIMDEYGRVVYFKDFWGHEEFTQYDANGNPICIIHSDDGEIWTEVHNKYNHNNKLISSKVTRSQ